MINFRYHVVTLTAVFLALGIGIVLGSTFLDRTFVDALNAQVSQLERRVVDKGDEIERLGQQLDAADASDEALLSNGIDALLTQSEPSSAVVIAERGIDEDLVAATSNLLSSTGTDVRGIIWLERDFDVSTTEGAAAVAALGEGTNSTDPTTDAVFAQFAKEIVGEAAGVNVATPSGPSGSKAPALSGASGAGSGTSSASGAPKTTVLSALTDAGMVMFTDVSGSRIDDSVFSPVDHVVMLSGEGEARSASAASLPIAEALTRESPRSVVVGTALRSRTRVDQANGSDVPDRSSFTAPFVESAVLDGRISTVDDIETPAGQVAIVMAIRQLASGTAGNYGIGKGADQVLPESTP